MNRVFVVERTHLNLREAEQFGQITYLTDSLDIFDTHSIDICKKQLSELQFNPSQDFLCITGNPVALVFLAIAVGEYPEFRLLIFDARSGSYRLRNYRNGRHVRKQGNDSGRTKSESNVRKDAGGI